MILQAFTEAALLGGFFVLAFGGIHLIPRRLKRSIRHAFHRRGF